MLVETKYFEDKLEQMNRKEWDGTNEQLREILLEEYLLDLENLELSEYNYEFTNGSVYKGQFKYGERWGKGE